MQEHSASLSGKHAIVFGVANKRSIAWAIAQAWHEAGAKIAFTYQGERLQKNVEDLVSTFGEDTPLYPCDVTRDEEIEYALSKGIPVVQTAASPYSIDENLFGRAIEAGVLEDYRTHASARRRPSAARIAGSPQCFAGMARSYRYTPPMLESQLACPRCDKKIGRAHV